MANWLIFSTQNLIDFSNGKTFSGTTITPDAQDQSGLPSAPYKGETEALNAVLAAGFTLNFVNGWSINKEYYFSK